MEEPKIITASNGTENHVRIKMPRYIGQHVVSNDEKLITIKIYPKMKPETLLHLILEEDGYGHFITKGDGLSQSIARAMDVYAKDYKSGRSFTMKDMAKAFSAGMDRCSDVAGTVVKKNDKLIKANSFNSFMRKYCKISI